MTQSRDNAQDAAPTDPRAVASIRKESPPVPLLAEGGRVVDRFGSDEVAQGLAKIIERVVPPYTISISGSWGVGKTTLARQLRTRLSLSPSASLLRFVEIDLWTEDIGDLRRRVALEVAVAVDDPAPERRDQALKRKAREFDAALRRVETTNEGPKFKLPETWPQRIFALVLVVGISVLLAVLWGYTTPVDPTREQTGLKIIATVGSALLLWLIIQSGRVFSVTSTSGAVQPVAEKVGLQLKFKEAVTKSQSIKVIVVLDNLDRLTGDAAVEALSEIRSFVELEQSRCLFLIPLDREALERHLRRTLEGDDRSARDYLDKFFNLDILLTKPVAADLRIWTRDLLSHLFPGVESSILSPVAEYAAAAADGSPRATKRILNGVYSRAYLLPRSSGVLIDELVVVEALIARFPTCVARLNSETRSWIASADLVRSTTDAGDRRRELTWMLGGSRSEASEADMELADEALGPFGNFVMQTRMVSLRPESVRAILSLRADREWGSVPRGDEAAIALQGGDAASLASIVADAAASDRGATIRVAIDQIERDRRQRLSVAVLNGINALAPVMVDGEDMAIQLGNVASDFLATTSRKDLRALTPAAIAFLFGRVTGMPRETRILERVTEELTPGGNPDASALVRILATVAHRLNGSEVKYADGHLGSLSDAELDPLFEDVSQTRALLLGGVAGRYSGRLLNWDAGASDQSGVVLAARRLELIGDWADRADQLSQIAANAARQVATMPDMAQDAALQIATMLRQAGPVAATDTFALALGESTHVALFEAGVQLASTPSLLEAAATKRLTAAGFQEFRDLVATRRSELEQAGVNVSLMSARRWAAGQGADYARITLASGRDDDADALVAAAGGIADAGLYVGIVEAAVPHLLELGAVRAAEGLLADIARRVPRLQEATVARLAPTVKALGSLSSAEPVVVALRSVIVGSPASSISLTAAFVREYVGAKVEGADALPPVLAEHGAAIGALDLDSAGWLLGRHGVKVSDVRTSLAAMIRTESIADLGPPLAMLRGRLSAAWQIGKALVERGAAAPEGSRDDWLVLAEEWNAPPSHRQPQANEDYRAALDAAASDPSAHESAARLRAKL